MDVIPVIDLARGVAVHARGGDRSRYEPVVSVLASEAMGEPAPILRAFRLRLGARSCYVADLDAIQGGAVQRAMLRELAQLETGFAGAIMVDAGAHTPASSFEVLATGASQVVIGLETLRAFADLRAIVRAVGGSRVAFSLDLRHGSPVLHPELDDAAGPPDPLILAGRAIEAGVPTLIVLDLARVGTEGGLDLGLIEALRRRYPESRLLVGGGVQGRRDLERLRDTGCDGALVASAIHAGTVTAADLADLAGEPLGAQSPSVSR
jgi:phosphoribosylformimino-5-aminoimidazole carboxamide ribotide isomerase